MTRLTWSVLRILVALAIYGLIAFLISVLFFYTVPARAAQGCEPPPWPPLAGPVVRLLPGDVRALSEVIFGEARGDGWCAKIAVGSVVLNRLRADPETWGASIAQVVNKPNQFSVFGKSDPNLKAMKRGNESDPAFFEAQQAAMAVLGGAPDPTAGAVYFFHRAMMPPPRWARGLKTTARIGSHIFMR